MPTLTQPAFRRPVPTDEMTRPDRHAAFAALFGAATIFVGCEDPETRPPGSDPDLGAVDGQFALEPTDPADMDPNELDAIPATGADDGLAGDPDDALAGFTNEKDAEVPGGDATLGDSRLGDGPVEDPDVNEYDSQPLVPGETDG